MRRGYDQYCPIAHALDLVGERWALLVVRGLMQGPKRYTDLADHLPGIGTNILASRLRTLEAAGIVTKRRLPPPAASQVYELTEYGRALRTVMRELAFWGARSLGPPTDDDVLYPGWLHGALGTMLADAPQEGRFEFRVGAEVASIADGVVHPGPIDDADVVVEADPNGMYYLLMEERTDGVSVTGDRGLLDQLLEAVSARA